MPSTGEPGTGRSKTSAAAAAAAKKPTAKPPAKGVVGKAAKTPAKGAADKAPRPTKGAADKAPGPAKGAADKAPGPAKGAANKAPGATKGAANKAPGATKGAANKAPGATKSALSAAPKGKGVPEAPKFTIIPSACSEAQPKPARRTYRVGESRVIGGVPFALLRDRTWQRTVTAYVDQVDPVDTNPRPCPRKFWKLPGAVFHEGGTRFKMEEDGICRPVEGEGYEVPPTAEWPAQSWPQLHQLSPGPGPGLTLPTNLIRVGPGGGQPLELLPDATWRRVIVRPSGRVRSRSCSLGSTPPPAPALRSRACSVGSVVEEDDEVFDAIEHLVDIAEARVPPAESDSASTSSIINSSSTGSSSTTTTTTTTTAAPTPALMSLLSPAARAWPSPAPQEARNEVVVDGGEDLPVIPEVPEKVAVETNAPVGGEGGQGSPEEAPDRKRRTGTRKHRGRRALCEEEIQRRVDAEVQQRLDQVNGGGGMTMPPMNMPVPGVPMGQWQGQWQGQPMNAGQW
ncbi:hypothetical protein C8A00DRAFT_32219 [Chaetomidium leptoderma]|uniref:Uncharacterized protein n=1 Tax=Chaetomidium leptoderma TaxID=669021 RepID=A0AAN6VR83_9PEZI|nr:hypothetical protein C8A00DRAFT_32219 [Chaetomidium leptoderma]